MMLAGIFYFNYSVSSLAAESGQFNRMDTPEEILAKVEALQVVNDENRNSAKSVLRRCDKTDRELEAIRAALSGKREMQKDD
jgi:hypothetical protein